MKGEGQHTSLGKEKGGDIQARASDAEGRWERGQRRRQWSEQITDELILRTVLFMLMQRWRYEHEGS